MTLAQSVPLYNIYQCIDPDTPAWPSSSLVHIPMHKCTFTMCYNSSAWACYMAKSKLEVVFLSCLLANLTLNLGLDSKINRLALQCKELGNLPELCMLDNKRIIILLLQSL